MTKATDTPPASRVAAFALHSPTHRPPRRPRPRPPLRRLPRLFYRWLPLYAAAVILACAAAQAQAQTPAASETPTGPGETHAVTQHQTTRQSSTESRSVAFAVLAGLPASERDVPAAQALLESIGSPGKVAFAVHLGDVKGPDEPCSDTLFAARRALLDRSAVPLVFIPGQADWIDCARPLAGGAEPLERLDAMRETFLSGPTSLGQQTLRVSRQSELPAYRPYRENTRWMDAGIVFVTIDVPNDNNHFLDGGGRNGEYEDREIANRYWISRAVTDAKRRQARGIVIFFQGNPRFTQDTREDGREDGREAGHDGNRQAGAAARPAFSWWFGRSRERDGYQPLRRDLVAAARLFPGPILLIYTGTSRGGRGFSVRPAVHDRSGKELHNLKRIEIDRAESGFRLTEWIKIQASSGKNGELDPTFRVQLEHVPLTSSSRSHTVSPVFLENVPTNVPRNVPTSAAPLTPRYDTGTSAVGAEGAGNRAQPGGGARSADTSGPVYPDNAYPEEKPLPDITGGDTVGSGATDSGAGDTGSTTSALGTITTPTLLPLPPLDSSGAALPRSTPQLGASAAAKH